MRFVFLHSHAFLRGCVAVEDDGSDGLECLVEFGDGVTIIGRWRRDRSSRPRVSHLKGHAGRGA
jgi:hypothetical protein